MNDNITYSERISSLRTTLLFLVLIFLLLFVWRTNWLLYLVTTPLGFVLFFYSLYRAWRAKMPAPPKFAAEGEINP